MTRLAPTEWWQPAPAGAGHPLVASIPRDERPGGGVAFRALMVFMVLMLLAPQAYVPALKSMRLALLAAVVALAARLIASAVHGRPLTVGGREIGLAAALVAWAVVTLPLSYWPGGSLTVLLDMYFKAVVLFWLLANAVDTLPRLRTMAWGLTLMAVPLALTGIKHFLEGAFIVTAAPVKRIGGYDAGLTANPNDLALTLNTILPLTVALLAIARSALARAVLVVIVLLLVAGVMVTLSRGGFVALATIFVAYLWRLIRHGRLLGATALLAAALAAFALAPSGQLGRLATITDIDADPTGSAQARWRDMQAAASFVLDHPLVGAGLGMNTLALNEVRGPAWAMVHNVYLEYAADLGLPALVLFLLLMFSCLKRVRSVRRRAGQAPALREVAALAAGIEIALLAFAVAALFHPVAYHFYFYYLAGLAVAASGLCDTAAAGPGPTTEHGS